MNVLDLCSGLPELRITRGQTLIEESVRSDRLYVLKSGAFEVVRSGVRVVAIRDPGAFLGEISAVLGSNCPRGVPDCRTVPGPADHPRC